MLLLRGGLLVLLLAACTGGAVRAEPAPQPATEVAMPSVSSGSQISAHDGQKVLLKGTYTQIEVRQRHPKDERPPEYIGHVAIVLEDGEQVFLEPTWEGAALRPEDERQRLDGQKVEVRGTLHAQQPEPEIPVAMPMGPCIAEVESIQPAN